MRVEDQSASPLPPLAAVFSALAVLPVGVIWPEWAAVAAALAALVIAASGGSVARLVPAIALAAGVAIFAKDLLAGIAAERWSWLAQIPGAGEVSLARQPALGGRLLGPSMIAALVIWVAQARVSWADARLVRGWSGAVVAIGAVVAFWLFLQPAGVAEFGRSFALGALQSRNALGAALGMVALLAVGAALEARAQREFNRVAVWLALAGVNAFAAVSLGSRGAWLGLLGGSAMLGWSRARQGRLGWSAWVAVMLAAGTILWLEPHAASRVGEIGREYRFEIWSAAARVGISQPWFGAGSGMFEPVFALFSGLQPPVGATIRHPDSSWVLFLFEHGLLGSALVLAAFVFVLTPGRGGEAGAKVSGWQWGARAAVVAWLCASSVDISLHRPVLLALGVPLVGIGWPQRAVGRTNRWLIFASGALILLVLLWSSKETALGRLAEPGYRREGEKVQLTPAGRSALESAPLDVALHHRLGRDAFVAGDYALAARHWRMVMDLQPANEEGVRAYARAMHAVRPQEALPFWRHFFRGAEERAASRLEATLNELGRTDVAYWRAAIVDRPELLVLLADEERPEAREAFADWLKIDLARSSTVPMRYVAPAFARWGDAPEFARWVAAAPRWPWGEGLQVAQRLLEGARSDLAWLVLTRMVKRPEPVRGVARSVDAALLARIQPGDFARLAEALGSGRLDREQRLKMLHAALKQANCPTWFRVELAYTLAEEQRRIEAGRELLDAARAMLSAQPGDW